MFASVLHWVVLVSIHCLLFSVMLYLIFIFFKCYAWLLQSDLINIQVDFASISFFALDMESLVALHCGFSHHTMFCCIFCIFWQKVIFVFNVCLETLEANVASAILYNVILCTFGLSSVCLSLLLMEFISPVRWCWLDWCLCSSQILSGVYS